MDFCKISYQPILRYLYTEVKKRRGKISLQKILIDSIHFVAMRLTAVQTKTFQN